MKLAIPVCWNNQCGPLWNSNLPGPVSDGTFEITIIQHFAMFWGVNALGRVYMPTGRGLGYSLVMWSWISPRLHVGPSLLNVSKLSHF